jgi:hypothetical protein
METGTNPEVWPAGAVEPSAGGFLVRKSLDGPKDAFEFFEYAFQGFVQHRPSLCVSGRLKEADVRQGRSTGSRPKPDG